MLPALMPLGTTIGFNGVNALASQALTIFGIILLIIVAWAAVKGKISNLIGIVFGVMLAAFCYVMIQNPNNWGNAIAGVFTN